MSDGPDPERGQDEKSPLERTLDVCLFAPVGMAVTVVEELPDLISKGRRRVELQLANARVVGRFVVSKTQRRVSNRVDEFLHNAPHTLGLSRPDEVKAAKEPVLRWK